MSETLLQRLDRIDKELAEIKSIKPAKQIDYSEGIFILENINKELTKKFADLNAKYYELNKELLVIKNKKPVEQVVNKKQEFDIKSEVEKIVNIAYINNIYRNK